MNFPDEIARWYLKNKRALPWRDTSDAYVIWLSEIILQQTRVEQGMPYFYRFLEAYPDVKSFAAAPEDEILRLWQGLGYYSRGRNMLKTARQITEQYGGIFPTKYDQLIKLKGIGEYTAAAISSFAADEAKAVVDGNVFRVLARYFGIDEPINSTKGKKLFQSLADELLNRNHPALHNQAMMEFGAVLCKPKLPDCKICPVRQGCFAFNNNKISILPKKIKKVTVRDRYFNYLLITDGDKVLMNKRDDTDIWANMYDLPLIETPSYIDPGDVTKLLHTHKPLGDTFRILACYPEKLHLLTHQRIHAQFIHVENQSIKLEQKYFFIEVKNIKMLALPKIINVFLTKFFNL
ncbi:MAG: A/G-specific adenine glycosylase [Bacteroidetes bacterium]|nr:A/G-specific adenine glycosylase [Bacteroidota bacterium]